MNAVSWRQLNASEIAALSASGCRAEDWGRVRVCDPFDPTRLRDVTFEGDVAIAGNTGTLLCRDGIERPCGIVRSLLRNTIVGERCLINNVGIALSNLEIGARVEIEHVGRIACTGESSFGNGHRIEALNEGGGRGLPITSQTSAQIAYMTTFYRHSRPLSDALIGMAREYARARNAPRAKIGSGSYISNCGELLDVAVGECATISGARLLRDGTVDSSVESPTMVGSDVIAEHFIIQRGASVRDGALVVSSLIGEAAQVGKQCSLENCAMFANTEAFHSELCAVFGGPYTVTHHRSTLLIAAYVSFFNAGSGTNQSNHMYKLGPVHQGILERGCKTGSSSYMLFPARAGAFSVVMGKHYSNFDASEFPFSYINEESGHSSLTPAMNLFTVGTVRDGAKWPSRDRRKGTERLDQIVFNVFSPYTAQRMHWGRLKLLELYEGCGKEREYVDYKGLRIKRLLLKTCARYYQLGLRRYLGDTLIARLSQMSDKPLSLILAPDPQGEPGAQLWIDMCGLLCPKSRVDFIVEEISSRRLQSLESVYAALCRIRESYESDEWNWVCDHYAIENGAQLNSLSAEALCGLIDDWAEAARKLAHMTLQDAAKEFESSARVGYGIDGGAEEDFAAVRGSFDSDAFAQQLRGHTADIARTQERVKALIQTNGGIA